LSYKSISAREHGEKETKRGESERERREERGEREGEGTTT